VKNLTVWRQSKFFGGQNTQTPPSQLEANQARKILNLIPNRDGSELKLRTGFSAVPWGDSSDVDFIKCILVLGCTTADPDGIYSIEGILGCDTNGTALDISIAVPDGTNIPEAKYITQDHVWTSGGTVPPDGGGDGTDTPDIPPVASGVKVWTSLADRGQKRYTTQHAGKIYGIIDWWTNDSGHFRANSSTDPGNNLSLWQSESATYVEDSTATDFLSNWPDNGSILGAKRVAIDYWYDETNGITVMDEESDQLVFGASLTFVPTWMLPRIPETIIEGEGTIVDPHLAFPAVTFKVEKPVQTDIFFLFSYSAAYTGACANLYARAPVNDSSDGVSGWTRINTVNGVIKPIFLRLQSALDAGQRYIMSTHTPSYIEVGSGIANNATVPYKQPFPVTEYKVEIVPDNHDSAYREEIESGGIFVGYYTSEMP
jgi:hypothetical protein